MEDEICTTGLGTYNIWTKGDRICETTRIGTYNIWTMDIEIRTAKLGTCNIWAKGDTICETARIDAYNERDQKESVCTASWIGTCNIWTMENEICTSELGTYNDRTKEDTIRSKIGQ